MPPTNPPCPPPTPDRICLRALLLEGAATPPDRPADAAYFDALRRRIDAAPPAPRPTP